MDVTTILTETPDRQFNDIPIHNKDEFVRYLMGIGTQVRTSIGEKTHKLSAERWKEIQLDIIEYFVSNLKEMPGHSDTSVAEIITRLNQLRNKKGRPPKKHNPWHFG